MNRFNPSSKDDVEFIKYQAEIFLLREDFPDVPYVLYALARHLTYQDLLHLIEDLETRILNGDAKLKYWVVKFLKKKETTDFLKKLARISTNPLVKTLPTDKQFKKLPHNEIVNYGLNLSSNDWFGIVEDVLINIASAVNRYPFSFKNMFDGLWDGSLVQIFSGKVHSVAGSYGLHPSSVAAQTLLLANEVFLVCGGSFLPPEEKDIVDENTELGWLLEEDDAHKPPPVVFKYVHPLSSKAEFSTFAAPEKTYKILLLGGMLASFPSWIKDNFEIQHIADNRTSAIEARRALVAGKPDAIILTRWLGHNLANVFQREARHLNIPFLIAKPSFSGAIQQAERDNLTWFTQAVQRIWAKKRATEKRHRRNPSPLDIPSILLTDIKHWASANLNDSSKERIQRIVGILKRSGWDLLNYSSKLKNALNEWLSTWYALEKKQMPRIPNKKRRRF